MWPFRRQKNVRGDDARDLRVVNRVESEQFFIEQGQEILVQLSGTTTNSRATINELVRRSGAGPEYYLEVEVILVRESQNKADSRAIAVHHEGARIGYLPGYLAASLSPLRNAKHSFTVQIFAATLESGLRAEAWIWMGDSRPMWEWTRSNRPPLTSEGKAGAAHQVRVEMVSEALTQGGSRAAEIRAGMVDGRHYLELIEPIKQLKRESRLEEALVLALQAIEGAENGRGGREPAPAYTEHAAIIYRKLGRRDEEIAILRRWLKYCPSKIRAKHPIQVRLDKLLAKEIAK